MKLSHRKGEEAMKKNILSPPLRASIVRGTVTLALLAVLVLAAAHLAPTFAAVASEPGVTEPDFAAIDDFVETQMQGQGIPGLALGIVQSDQIVHLKGFGLADPSGRPVTPQTPFVL